MRSRVCQPSRTFSESSCGYTKPITRRRTFTPYNQDFEAKLAIETGELIEGRLPRAVLRMTREWMRRHRLELTENWRRAREELPLEKIAGADVD